MILTHMFIFCPPTPPSDVSQGPALSNWGKHEAILCSSTTKAVHCVMLCTINPCICSHLCNLFLHNIYWHCSSWVYWHSICTNCRKYVVVRLEGPSKQIHLIEVEPIEKIGVHIKSGCIHLRIDVIKVTYLQNGEFCVYMLLEGVLTTSLLITTYHPLLPILTVSQFDLKMGKLAGEWLGTPSLLLS